MVQRFVDPKVIRCCSACDASKNHLLQLDWVVVEVSPDAIRAGHDEICGNQFPLVGSNVA